MPWSPNQGHPPRAEPRPVPGSPGFAPLLVPNPLTRDTLVVFGATGAEASNEVALAAGEESVIEV